MNKTIDFGISHPVVDAIARNITLLSSEPVAGLTLDEVAKHAADLADTFAKHVTAQRDIVLSRLQIMHAYLRSFKAGNAVELDVRTAAFCDELGFEDWRERGLDELLSYSHEQLKNVRYEWFRAEIYRIVTRGELLIELKTANCQLTPQQHPANTQ